MLISYSPVLTAIIPVVLRSSGPTNKKTYRKTLGGKRKTNRTSEEVSKHSAL
jgi:hypothetical protein